MGWLMGLEPITLGTRTGCCVPYTYDATRHNPRKSFVSYPKRTWRKP
jgi:hypothetical protein